MVNIYIKSKKGTDEFAGNTRTLNLKQRKLLIMIDGMRTSTELIKLFSNINATQALQDLATLGYIVDKAIAQKPEKQVNTSRTEVTDSLGHEHLSAIKTLLLNELELQTGVMMHRDLAEIIKHLKHSTELKPITARWHMAIRDSKNGRKIADELMGKLHHLMANPPSESLAEIKPFITHEQVKNQVLDLEKALATA